MKHYLTKCRRCGRQWIATEVSKETCAECGFTCDVVRELTDAQVWELCRPKEEKP